MSMIDFYALAGLDWSRIQFAAPAPCAHGMSGAPYCVQCLTPILEAAADEQARERALADAQAAARTTSPEPGDLNETLADPDWVSE